MYVGRWSLWSLEHGATSRIPDVNPVMIRERLWLTGGRSSDRLSEVVRSRRRGRPEPDHPGCGAASRPRTSVASVRSSKSCRCKQRCCSAQCRRERRRGEILALGLPNHNRAGGESPRRLERRLNSITSRPEVAR